MNTLRVVIVTVLSLCLCPMGMSLGKDKGARHSVNTAQSIGDYRSVATGSWNSPLTWERFAGSAWTVPSSAPDSGSSHITVRSGHVVTITAATIYDQLTVEVGGQVVVASGVPHTLTDGPGDDLTVEGTWLNQGGSWTIVGSAKWIVSDGGTFIQNSTAAISTPLSKCTLAAGSNFIYRGSTSLTPASSFSGRTYGNLTFESVLGQWSCTVSGSSPLTISGSLHIGNGVKWNTGGFSGTMIVQGMTIIEGEWSGTGNGNLAAHTFQGEFRIGSGGKYQLGTTGTTQGNIIFRTNFVNEGAFASPMNRIVFFDGLNPQTVGGSSATSFIGGLITNQKVVVEAGAAVHVGAGKSMTANSDVDLFGSISGGDAMATLVLAGAGSRLNLHEASLSVPIVLMKYGQRHIISGKGVFAGCDVRADSGSTIVLDAHLTLEDSKLNPCGGEFTPASGSTIVYRGSSARPICPLQYWNLVVESNPGAYLAGPTSVHGQLSLNTGTLTTGAYSLVLEADAILHEVGSASVIGKVMTTRMPKRGIKESLGNIGFDILTSVEAEDSITVSRVSGSAPTVRGGSAVAKYFELSFRGKQLSASLVLHYTTRDLIGKTETGLRLLRSTDLGASWSDAGVSANISGQTLTYSGLVSDSRWTAAEMFPPPTLTAIAPASGSQGSRLTVVMTGTGFEFGVSQVVFSGQGISVNSVSVTSPNRCSVDIAIDSGATRGIRDVAVTTSAGTAILHNVFEVLQPPNPVPTLVRIAPLYGTRGKNTTVTLYGDGLLSEATCAKFGDSIGVRSVRASGASLVVEIIVAIGANPGLRDVTVTNPSPGGGSATLRSAFLVANPVPVVTSVFPTEGICGQVTSVTLEGTDFIAGVTTVIFGEGTEVDSIRVLSSTQLQVNVRISASALTGFRDVSVVNIGPGGGTGLLLGGFRVTLPVPKIFAITPSIGVRGTSMKVSITGSNLLSGLSSLMLGNDVFVESLAVLNSCQMSGILRIPCTARPGPRIATIINSGPGGGSSSLANAFEVHNPVPCIKSVNPPVCVIGRTTEVELSGSGFIDSVSSIIFGAGITVQASKCDSAGAHLSANVTVSACVDAGAHTISVMNSGPGGGAMTFSDGFMIENPRPSIIAVDPAGCARGMSARVRITGRDFLTGKTTVSFDPGIKVDSIIENNDTSMSVRVAVDSSAVLGARWVVVTNPPPGGGKAVLPHVFNVEMPVPSITRVTPESARRGERISVVVEGMNFATDVSKVSFGDGLGVDSLTVISASRLRLLLLIPEEAAIGPRTVSVFNPPPGGGTATLPNGFLVQSRAVTSVGLGDQSTPRDFELAEPYPNPFNPSVRIRFALPERSIVRLTVHNTLGIVVTRALDEEKRIGVHEVNWFAGNLASGVYFIRFQAESLESRRRFISFKKVALIK